ncbi:MAG: SH3 domain-containing protein, partial [Ruthenibacterium sp.]
SDRCTIKTAPKTDKLRALYNLNVRSAPGTKYASLGLLKIGETAESLETDGAWRRIAAGWIHADKYTEAM